jgi:LmbE family N-acetylglucosaminyl deacetylase
VAKIIVFAPHPDDEVLGCGGVIAKRLSEGHNVSVIFLTDGRNCLKDLGVLSEPSPLELKEIRKEEAERSARTLGVRKEDLTFLEIEDGKLQENEGKARESVAETLKESLPKEVFFPQKREFNVDHRVTNRVVRNSLDQLHFCATQYQYRIAWSYPFNLLERVSSKRARYLLMSKLLELDMIHVDISEFLPLKEAALREYKSQLEILSRRQRRPVLRESLLHTLLKNEEDYFVKGQMRNTS